MTFPKTRARLAALLLPLAVGAVSAPQIGAPVLAASGEGDRAAGEDRQRGPDLVATWDGDPVHQVLPPGRIPAISSPTFVTGERASAQMHADEPVIGVVFDGEPRAYSLWQLDTHEIVNDRAGDVAFSVTW
jgi:hypothetical protein